MTREVSQPDPSPDPCSPQVYQIRLKGILSDAWSDWFDEMMVVFDSAGCTVLSGPVTDQAALFGLLDKIRDLGLPLLSVIKLENESPEVSR